MKRIIKTKDAPAAIGSYSQAVEINGMLFISGQLPVNPVTGKIEVDDITGQTKQVLENISAILQASGYSLKEVVKSTCLLSDLSNFAAMNEVYASYYNSEPPARTTFAVKGLPLGALVEIDTIAVKAG